jgi:glycosyltransferase involved in cell wall biosynthesis
LNRPARDTIVIIPAFNEEASIALVLDDLPKERLLEVIVVNNNSSDRTSEVAIEHGAKVIFEKTMGYGQACLTGLELAYTYNPEIIAFIDGDYSDFPEELSLLLKEIDQGADLVIGSRTRGRAEEGALLPQAIFGNWLATTLMRLFFKGPSFTDLGPFRAIKTSAIKEIQMRDRDFGWTVEMQVKALMHELKCFEISVGYKKRIGISKITGTLKGTVKAGYKILGLIFYLKLRSFFR